MLTDGRSLVPEASLGHPKSQDTSVGMMLPSQLVKVSCLSMVPGTQQVLSAGTEEFGGVHSITGRVLTPAVGRDMHSITGWVLMPAVGRDVHSITGRVLMPAVGKAGFPRQQRKLIGAGGAFSFEGLFGWRTRLSKGCVCVCREEATYEGG